MNECDDMEIFLRAIENIPDDVLGAKYEGAPKKRHTAKAAPDESEFDRTIDLHGMTKKEALSVLRTSLSRAKGRRLKILVITGRGNNSPDGRSVVRDAVLTFLKRAGSIYVRDYCFAGRKNGGDGAIEIVTK